MKDDNNALSTLRLLAFPEAATPIGFVCIAVPLKHLAGYPIAVSVMGPVHGIAFVLYMWMIISTTASGLWRGPEVCRLVIAAIVPFGGLVSASWIARRGIQQ